MTRLVLALLAVLAACEPPSPRLRIAFSDTTVGLCPSTDCNEVPMLCPSYAGIRIIDPADPKAPYHSQCTMLQTVSSRPTICAIGSVPLESARLPVRTLEVQVAIFPAEAITTDPMTLEPICPADTQYDAATGFPVASLTSPAVAGRAFYHPGDEEVVVTMGCLDLGELNTEACGGGGGTPVSAQVVDFDSRFSVPPDSISVLVGEPQAIDQSSGIYELPSNRLISLMPPTQDNQAWNQGIAMPFSVYACLAVRDDAAQSTFAVSCRLADPNDTTEAWPTEPPAGVPDDAKQIGNGVRISNATLDKILGALSLTDFPNDGLTIGVVLDASGDPMANQTITATGGTVQYLSPDLRSLAGPKTSSSGVWVSQDAPFGTTFGVTNGLGKTVTRLGGRIQGEATIVMLQFTGGGI